MSKYFNRERERERERESARKKRKMTSYFSFLSPFGLECLAY
jgi:hypothetical protein